MFDIIVATDMKGGIGYENTIPWHCPGDLQLFKKKTMNCVLIMGRKTVENLPRLPGRHIICISKNSNLDTSQYKNKVEIFTTIEKALVHTQACYANNKVFVAGGGMIYTKVFQDMLHLIDKVHYSTVQSEEKCDVYLNSEFLRANFIVKEFTKYDGFVHCVYTKGHTGEKQYLDLLRDVFVHGVERKGRNGITKSMFGKHIKFDLREGYPLLTTKKMFFRGVVEELLFFIRGDTDSKVLERKRINIWKGNTSREFLDKTGKEFMRGGLMGPMYGYQWRNYNAPYNHNNGEPVSEGMDQLQNVVKMIREDPTSRRILLTDYNPLQARDGVLYPCHSIIVQFYVSEGYLDMFCFNRSSDLFLGLPFNIASTSLFLVLISRITGLKPRFVNISLGDAHIYAEHISAVKEQISRVPFTFPTVIIKKELNTLEDIEKLEYKDFQLGGYYSHSSIKAPMIA